MAYVEGTVDYIADISDADGLQVLIHFHVKGICYSSTFRDGPAAVIQHLYKKGDRIGVSGVISSLDGYGYDVDAGQIHTQVDGAWRALSVGHHSRHAGELTG